METVKGRIFGYGRVSTKEQNPARQREALAGKCNYYFEDKYTGRNMERPELKKMLDKLHRGDTVMVLSIDRLGRNLRDLINISNDLYNAGVNIVTVDQKVDTSTPTGKMFFNVMALFADMELLFIKERQREGIEIAKREGRFRGRPVKELKELEQLSKEVDAGKLSVTRACKLLGISRSTFYRRKERMEAEEIDDDYEIDF